MAARAHDLAIGLVTAADPRDPAAFSGCPASLLGGMTEVAGTTIALNGALPLRTQNAASLLGALGNVRPGDLRAPRAALARTMPASWLFGRPAVVARSARVRAQLRGRALDGCVSLGTEVLLPRGLPVVTYQDSTLVQARDSYPWPHLGAPNERELERWVAHQREAYRGAIACCTRSHWAADSIVADYGIPREKVHVVGIGRHHDVVPPTTRDWSVPRFLFVGFDWERKNGPMLVRAFAEVRRRHPDAELDLVGGHPPVDAPGVIGHGSISLGDAAGAERLADLYRRATCFVMVSVHEPAGAVYAEAAAAGIPSIGTTNGGSATIIGAGGVLVDPRDERALTATMVRLCDADVARELGARAADHAQQLTWERVAQRLVRALGIADGDDDRLAAFL
jgi:glycosyltransferase involved in cell wall biosynthesis